MKKRIALALIMAATVAFGSVACDDGGTSTDATDGFSDAAVCDPSAASETDTGTITFDITKLQLPTSKNSGVNLDGQTSSTSTAAGCYQTDGTPGGVDNQLSEVNTTATATGLNIAKAVQDAVTSGSVKLRAVVTKWNGTLTDSCIAISFQADTGTGYAAIGSEIASKVTAGVTPFFGISAPVSLNVSVDGTKIMPTACVPGTYPATGTDAAPACANQTYDCQASIPLQLKGLRVRAHIVADSTAPGGQFRLATNTPLDGAAKPTNVPAMTTIANPTLLGGYLTFWDTTATGRPSCTNAPLPSTDTSFEATLQGALCDLGQGKLWTTACGILSGKLDLHAEGSALTSCNAGASATNSNANSLSLAAFAGN